jgi:NADH-quinone oxidoreductase subunit E
MTIETKGTDLSSQNTSSDAATVAVQATIQATIQAAIDKHGAGPDAVIPILQEINSTFGYIPAKALQIVSQRTHLPDRQVHISESQLYSLASFYRMFSTKPLGRHIVRFCESAPCHVVGGREVWQALQDVMALKAGETSSDGKWSLITTSCLGICAVGPVILIDDDVYGNVTPEQLPELLAKYE